MKYEMDEQEGSSELDETVRKSKWMSWPCGKANLNDYTGETRALLIDWWMELTNKHSWITFPIHLAVALLDYFFHKTQRKIETCWYKVCLCACFFIASKFESSRDHISVNTIVCAVEKKTRITSSDIFKAEWDILHETQFGLACLVTTWEFVRFREAFYSPKIAQLASAMADVTLLYSDLALVPPWILCQSCFECASIWLSEEEGQLEEKTDVTTEATTEATTDVTEATTEATTDVTEATTDVTAKMLSLYAECIGKFSPFSGAKQLLQVHRIKRRKRC